MSKDDFEVIAYKLLSYLYECIKQGVRPNMAKAQEVAGCNDVYWAVVLKSLLNDGYISGNVECGWHGTVIHADIDITMNGAAYVTDNSRMRKAAMFLGQAFAASLEAAVADTTAL